MQLNKLSINPDNPFPFKGDEQEWQDFLDKLKRDPEFLEARPIVYDSSDKVNGGFKVLAGNKRYKGYVDLGFKSLPDERFFDCKDWSKEKKRRFELADNWHPSGSNWDVDFTTDEEKIEWDIFFSGFDGGEDDQGSGNGGSTSEGEKESITLNYTSHEHKQVVDALAKVGQTPEAAVWNLLIEKKLITDE